MAEIGDIANADIGGIVGTAGFWLVMIMFMLVLVGVLAFAGLWIFRMLLFKISVNIYEHVGDGNHLGRKDVAKEVDKDIAGKRTRFIRLLKGRKSIGPFGSEKFITFGVRKHLNLHLQDGIYTPLPVLHNSDPGLTFKKEDLLTALQLWDQDYAENLETHKWGEPGFMDKYGAYVLPFAMIIIMFVLFFILIQEIGGGVNVIATLDTSQLVKAA